MYTVRVIPLTRLPAHAPAVLDYFWSESLVRGSLVHAPIGKRTILAIVLDCQDIRSSKLSLKKSSFALKKLRDVVSEAPQLTAGQLELARWISTQYACSLATALNAVAPAFIGKRGSLTDHSAAVALQRAAPLEGIMYVTQPETALAILRKLVSNANGQTLILVPDRLLAETLTRLIGPQAHCVHTGLKATEYRTLYRGVLSGTITTVVGTRSALFLPWTALTQVIVEDPLNEVYKSESAPRINASDVARQLATLHGARITWLTPAMSTVQYHFTQSATLAVHDEKPYWPAITLSTAESEQQAGQRTLFGRAAQDAILDAYEHKKSLLLFSARRGYATVARCSRCTTPIPCATCEIPLRWHRTSEDMLVCYHCGAFRTVPKQCPTCKAGALKPSGTPGSQKLVEAINTTLDRFGYPKLSIPILDSDLILTPEDAVRTVATFDAMEHPILVATSMINSYRYSRAFGTIIVPHLDMLATNPDYRTQERLLLQLEKLADFKPERMILQTYQDDGLAPYIVNRQWKEFYTLELAHRRSLRWPPYSRIIKISFTHRDKGAAARAAAIAADRITRAIAHLKAAGTRILGPAPTLTERTGGRWTQTIILKSTLPSSRLSELLQYVPEGWNIDVDPRTIS